MMGILIALRKKLINCLNRAFYFGQYRDFQAWCGWHCVKFDESWFNEEWWQWLKDKPIARIERCKVRIGDLRILLFGRKYAVKDTLCYQIFMGGGQYSEWIVKLQATGDHDKDGRDDGYAQSLVQWIDKDVIKGKPIVITTKDMILDGLHRTCAMLLKYGENYRIDAIRVYMLPAEGSLLQKIYRNSSCTSKRRRA